MKKKRTMVDFEHATWKPDEWPSDASDLDIWEDDVPKPAAKKVIQGPFFNVTTLRLHFNDNLQTIQQQKTNYFYTNVKDHRRNNQRMRPAIFSKFLHTFGFVGEVDGRTNVNWILDVFCFLHPLLHKYEELHDHAFHVDRLPISFWNNQLQLKNVERKNQSNGNYQISLTHPASSGVKGKQQGILSIRTNLRLFSKRYLPILVEQLPRNYGTSNVFSFVFFLACQMMEKLSPGDIDAALRMPSLTVPHSVINMREPFQDNNFALLAQSNAPLIHTNTRRKTVSERERATVFSNMTRRKAKSQEQIHKQREVYETEKDPFTASLRQAASQKELRMKAAVERAVSEIQHIRQNIHHNQMLQRTFLNEHCSSKIDIRPLLKQLDEGNLLKIDHTTLDNYLRSKMRTIHASKNIQLKSLTNRTPLTSATMAMFSSSMMNLHSNGINWLDVMEKGKQYPELENDALYTAAREVYLANDKLKSHYSRNTNELALWMQNVDDAKSNFRRIVETRAPSQKLFLPELDAAALESIGNELSQPYDDNELFQPYDANSLLSQ